LRPVLTGRNFLKQHIMQNDKNKDSKAYPQRTEADEQFRNQDEFSTLKPNEKAPTNSDLPQPVPQSRNSTAPGDENYEESDRGRG
jgi:hypothetical protein